MEGEGWRERGRGRGKEGGDDAFVCSAFVNSHQFCITLYLSPHYINLVK